MSHKPDDCANHDAEWQARYLKEAKGVTFSIVSEAEAVEFLKDKTFFFVLSQESRAASSEKLKHLAARLKRQANWFDGNQPISSFLRYEDALLEFYASRFRAE